MFIHGNYNPYGNTCTLFYLKIKTNFLSYKYIIIINVIIIFLISYVLDINFLVENPYLTLHSTNKNQSLFF